MSYIETPVEPEPPLPRWRRVGGWVVRAGRWPAGVALGVLVPWPLRLAALLGCWAAGLLGCWAA